MDNKTYDIENPEKLEIVHDFDENNLALVRYRGKDFVFFINRYYTRVSDTFILASKFDGKYYAVMENSGDNSCAYYEYNGRVLEKASKNYEECFPFNNELDIGLVREGIFRAENYDGDLIYPYYFVDRDFTRISPYYINATQFDNVCGVARVEPLQEKDTYFVNDEFVKVSPKFYIAFGLDSKGIIVGSEEEGLFAFYSYDMGEFNKVSKEYAYAHGFGKNDVTTVQDKISKKYYVIDRLFTKVSEDYDHATAFSGYPAIANVKQGKKTFAITALSLSKVEDSKFYSDLFKKLKQDGCDISLTSINEIIKNKIAEGAKKKDVVKDVKTAVKDYLISSLTALLGSVKNEDLEKYLNEKMKLVEKAIKDISINYEPDEN